MNTLPFPNDANGVPYYNNPDASGNMAQPTEQYIRNTNDIFVPVSATNPQPTLDATVKAVLDSILAKILAAPATEAKQDALIAKDFASETTLATILTLAGFDAKADIALTALRDAIKGTSNKTLTDLATALASAATTAKQDTLAGLVATAAKQDIIKGVADSILAKLNAGIALSGSNTEQTLNAVLPTKANLMGISDGTKIQAIQGVKPITLLASAERTATLSAPIQTNINHKGVVIVLKVTAASGIGGLSLRVMGIVDGNGYYLTAAPAAVTANGTYVYVIYPAAIAGVLTQMTNQILPYQWRVDISHSDASAYTYSVSAAALI